MTYLKTERKNKHLKMTKTFKIFTMIMIASFMLVILFLCLMSMKQPTKASGTITFQKEYADTVVVR